MALDYSARILIRYCLARAAKTVVDKSKDWAALAAAAGAERIDLVFVRALREEDEFLNTTAPSDRARELIEARIKRLAAFQKMAAAMAAKV